MKYMLDTNICIYAIKNKPECVFWHISDNIKNGLCISVITFAELQYGIAKSNYPEKNAKSLSKLLSYMSVFPFDETAAEEEKGMESRPTIFTRFISHPNNIFPAPGIRLLIMISHLLYAGAGRIMELFCVCI